MNYRRQCRGEFYGLGGRLVYRHPDRSVAGPVVRKDTRPEELHLNFELTWEDMMLLAWTAMLYSDDPTVLVLTVPEFLLVMATEITKHH